MGSPAVSCRAWGGGKANCVLEVDRTSLRLSLGPTYHAVGGWGESLGREDTACAQSLVRLGLVQRACHPRSFLLSTEIHPLLLRRVCKGPLRRGALSSPGVGTLFPQGPTANTRGPEGRVCSPAAAVDGPEASKPCVFQQSLIYRQRPLRFMESSYVTMYSFDFFSTIEKGETCY